MMSSCDGIFQIELQVREYLEKHYKETSGKATIKLAIQAITETVEAGSKSIELAVVEPETGLRFLEVGVPKRRRN